MGYFPMCMDLKGKTVLLVGVGPQTADKMEKLGPFGCELRQIPDLHETELTEDIAFVVVGDTGPEAAARISAICMARRVPVNVVDKPELSSFCFPALVTRGDLTVAVSTGGKSPGAAAYLAGEIGKQLPHRTEKILDWLCEIRSDLYGRYPKETARQLLSRLTREAFTRGRPLTDGEAGA